MKTTSKAKLAVIDARNLLISMQPASRVTAQAACVEQSIRRETRLRFTFEADTEAKI
jgi:hypothetical protein